MAGNEDEGGGDWALGLMLQLRGLIDQTVAVLAAEPVKTGDIVGLDRRARAITSLARAGKAVGALRVRPKTRPDVEEDAMSDDDSDDVDPAELERLRAELQSRLDHLRAGIERKRVEGWPVRQAAEGGDPGGAQAAPASGDA